MTTNRGLHPGISVHHIEVGGGIAGSLVVVVSMLTFLMGVPALWSFLGGAAGLGVGVACVFRILHRKDLDSRAKILV